MSARRSRPFALPARDTAVLKAQLLQHRHALESRLRQELTSARGDGSTRRPVESADGADVLETEVQNDLAFALMESRAEMIARIDEALRRVDAGRYGRCVECGDAIGAPRLNALPFATRCVGCERDRERVGTVSTTARRAAGPGGPTFSRPW